MSIFDYFRGRKPAPKAKPVRGFLGTGGTAEHKANRPGRWTQLTPEEAAGFLDDGNPQLFRSSAISWCQYLGGEFMVEFIDERGRSAGIYWYQNVPREVVIAFLEAPSKGTFVNATFVKPKWPFRKG